MLSTDRRNFGKVVPAVNERPFHGDQAAALRSPAPAARRAGRVIAVTSGKGGVGKTNLSVNLALALAQLGRRVTLVDLDLGLANADVLWDVMPKANLASVLSGRKRLSEVIVRTPEGVRFVPGASGVEHLANLPDAERAALLESLEQLALSADFILFDTAAGISKNTTAFLAAADEVLIVTTPEPTAVVDAYAVIKILSRHEDRGDLGLVVNMAQSEAEADRFAKGITVTAYRMLNTYVEHRGSIPMDRAVGQAVRLRRPFLLSAPASAASVAVREVARRLTRAGETAPARSERPGLLRRLVRAFAGA